MAASEVMTSGTGVGEERRSESHMESMSDFSQKSPRVKRNSPPSLPTGHGPGMIPMRYLMVIGAHRTCRSPKGQGYWANLLRHTSFSVGSDPQRTNKYASGRCLPRASSGSQLDPVPESLTGSLIAVRVLSYEPLDEVRASGCSCGATHHA